MALKLVTTIVPPIEIQGIQSYQLHMVLRSNVQQISLDIQDQIY